MHRNTRPHGACVHSNARLGCGSVMNILGIGLDATDIARVADLLDRYGDRFLHRVFTSGEIAYCTKRRNPAPHLAGRFAVKEAAMKALGTGQSQGVLWKDIEVVRHGGPPRIQLHGGAARRADTMKVTRSLVTITHSETLAMAQVMLLGD
jgi:holo-[acyl-carrier protein] synthase